MKFNCLTGAKKIKLIIRSSCFAKKKAVFNVHIGKDKSERFIQGLQDYIRHWEEENGD